MACPIEGKAHQEKRRLARPIREKAQKEEKKLRRVKEKETACMARPRKVQQG